MSRTAAFASRSATLASSRRQRFPSHQSHPSPCTQRSLPVARSANRSALPRSVRIRMRVSPSEVAPSVPCCSSVRGAVTSQRGPSPPVVVFHRRSRSAPSERDLGRRHHRQRPDRGRQWRVMREWKVRRRWQRRVALGDRSALREALAPTRQPASSPAFGAVALVARPSRVHDPPVVADQDRRVLAVALDVKDEHPAVAAQSA